MSTEIKQEDLKPNECIIEDLGMKGKPKYLKHYVNIIFKDLRLDNVVYGESTKRYWIAPYCKGRKYWVKEEDLYKTIFEGFIPDYHEGKVNQGKHQHGKTTLKTKVAVDHTADITARRSSTCINYLWKNIRDPKIDARNPIDNDRYHTYDISMLLISCKTIGQFMDEVQAFLPDLIKTPSEFDWYYLDDPDHQDTSNDIKLKTWYTRQRAKCKVILSKLQLCYGGLQKNGYQFFLTSCFTKEFGKPETIKKTNVSVETKSEKVKAEEELIADTTPPVVNINFCEEVSHG
jgi:hypothetical protein